MTGPAASRRPFAVVADPHWHALDAERRAGGAGEPPRRAVDRRGARAARARRPQPHRADAARAGRRAAVAAALQPADPRPDRVPAPSRSRSARSPTAPSCSRVVVANSAIGFVQEWRAGRAIQALAALVPERATVRPRRMRGRGPTPRRSCPATSSSCARRPRAGRRARARRPRGSRSTRRRSPASRCRSPSAPRRWRPTRVVADRASHDPRRHARHVRHRHGRRGAHRRATPSSGRISELMRRTERGRDAADARARGRAPGC